MKIIIHIIVPLLFMIAGCSVKTYEESVDFFNKNQRELVAIDSTFQLLPKLREIRKLSGDWPNGKLGKKYERFSEVVKYEINYSEQRYYVFLTTSKIESILELTSMDYETNEDTTEKFANFVWKDSLDIRLFNSIIERIHTKKIMQVTKADNHYTLFYQDRLSGLGYKSNIYGLAFESLSYIETKKINDRWYYFREKL